MQKQKELNAPTQRYDSSGMGIFDVFSGELKHRPAPTAADYDRKKYTLKNPDGSYMIVESQSPQDELRLKSDNWLEGELHPQDKDSSKASKLIHWIGPNGENQYLNPGQEPLKDSFEVDPQVDAAVITEHTNLVNNVMDEKFKLMDQLDNLDLFIDAEDWELYEAKLRGEKVETWWGGERKLSKEKEANIEKYLNILEKIEQADSKIEMSKDRLRGTRFRNMVEGPGDEVDPKDPLGILK